MAVVALLFSVFYLLPIALLSIPSVQHKMSEAASEELSNLLAVPVRVKNVQLEWLNRLVLEDVSVEDQSGGSLLEASYLSAGFQLLPLFQQKLVFTTVRLFGLTMNLNKAQPGGELNLQFIIDAFAGDSTKKDSPIDLRINSILIRRSTFRYDVQSAPELIEKFDPNHILVENLNAKVSLKAFNQDSINAQVSRLSFDEKSGWGVQKLSMGLTVNNEQAILKNLEIRMPNTNFLMPHASIDYSQVDSVEQLYTKAPISLEIASSKIGANDFAAVLPFLKNFSKPFDLAAQVEGVLNDIKLREVLLDHEDGLHFSGNMNVRNWLSDHDLYLQGKVQSLTLTNDALRTILNAQQVNPERLPIDINQLGTTGFTGEISGFPDNMVAYGRLITGVGNVEMDVLLGQKSASRKVNYVSGKISTGELDVGSLMKHKNPYGIVQFDVDIDAKQQQGGSYYGNVNANVKRLDFKAYEYKDLLIEGSFSKDAFEGMIHVDDPNLYVHAEGVFNNKIGDQEFNFQAQVKNFRPDSLHLTDKYEQPEISFAINSNFTNTTLEELQGHIVIDSLEFKSLPGNFLVKQIKLETAGSSIDRTLTIDSDIVHADLRGGFSFQTLLNNLRETVHAYLPALDEDAETLRTGEDAHFDLMLTVHNTDSISRLLKLPVSFLNDARLIVSYNKRFDKFRAEAYLPSYTLGNKELEGGYLKLENPKGRGELLFQSTMKGKNEVKNFFELSSTISANRMNSRLNWKSSSDRAYRADLELSTLFNRIRSDEDKGKSKLNTTLMFNQGTAVIMDSLWHVYPSSIQFQDGTIEVNKFNLSKENQYLRINGEVSKDPRKMLFAELKDIELGFIFDILNKPSLTFGGKATGTVNMNDMFGSRILNTDLTVERFSFNRVEVGKLNLFSEWDDNEQGILLLGSIYSNDSTWTDVNGYIYPVGEKAGLSLYFDANDINIAFIQPYMENVAKGLKGRGYGRIHVFGPFSGVTVEGDGYVKDGGLGIDFLNTYYTFSDSIHLTPTSISARNLTIYDEDGHQGTVNLEVTHHTFDDIAYKVELTADNLLAYNVTSAINPMIFGKVYASGMGSLRGNDNRLDIEVNAMTNPHTTMTLDFMSNNKTEEYDFIEFVDKDEIGGSSTNEAGIDTLLFSRLKDTGLDMHMTFNLNVTPDATIELVMDPVSGDLIKGKGQGNIEINYGTRSDLTMYGTCTITDGKYNFSLQQVIRKDFQIAEGSAVTFTGNPYDAILDIQGIYSLSANINDLDESLSQEMARTSIPVNCLLNVMGKLRSPTIGFDIALPTVNEDIEQRVKSYIDTEDMMLRQIVYLLVLNKFYTPDHIDNEYNSGMSALASSALSYQLSSILSSITDVVQIGTNIRANQARGNQEMEVEMLLSSQLLDNRLTINGNFGYRDTDIQRNTFIGEFDLEYKLTRDGGIRLKAYNHANDMYRYYKSSLNRQGVGVMFRRDFTNLYDLFNIRRKRLVLPTVENEATESAPSLDEESTK